MERTVCGRPGRFGLDRAACRPGFVCLEDGGQVLQVVSESLVLVGGGLPVGVVAGHAAAPSGRSTRWPRSKRAPARTNATRWDALTARQRACADSINLKTMPRAAARLPALLVTFVRRCTVAMGRPR
jgi:hypothetical protein